MNLNLKADDEACCCLRKLWYFARGTIKLWFVKSIEQNRLTVQRLGLRLHPEIRELVANFPLPTCVRVCCGINPQSELLRPYIHYTQTGLGSTSSWDQRRKFKKFFFQEWPGMLHNLPSTFTLLWVRVLFSEWMKLVLKAQHQFDSFRKEQCQRCKKFGDAYKLMLSTFDWRIHWLNIS